MADSLQLFCAKSLNEVGNIVPKNNINLLHEVTDIKAWAHVGLPFAHKLRAAVSYQEYLDTKEKQSLKLTIAHLETATNQWSELVKVTSPVYKPAPIEPMGYKVESNLFHWSIIQAQVVEELKWLKEIDK